MRQRIEQLSELITPTVEGLGYELVRLLLTGGGKPTLQIMAERQDGTGMGIDDCTLLSRQLSAFLDVEDPIASSYVLEVSSPGIDRPLTRAKDYTRFQGHTAKLETFQPIDGQRRFRGELLGLAGDAVRLKVEGGEEIQLPLPGIAKAQLVLTDALIKAHQSAAETGEKSASNSKPKQSRRGSAAQDSV